MKKVIREQRQRQKAEEKRLRRRARIQAKEKAIVHVAAPGAGTVAS
jgi:hypothetical protein